MSSEEFYTIKIPWKNSAGVDTEEEVIFKRSLKGFEVMKLLQAGKLDTEGNLQDITSLLSTLTQMTITKAPFDHKNINTLLDLDAKILFKIIGGVMEAIPLEEYFKDLNLPTSPLNPVKI